MDVLTGGGGLSALLTSYTRTRGAVTRGREGANPREMGGETAGRKPSEVGKKNGHSKTVRRERGRGRGPAQLGPGDVATEQGHAVKTRKEHEATGASKARLGQESSLPQLVRKAER